MRAIRFGGGRWAAAGVTAPRLAGVVVVAAIVLGLTGAPQLRFGDDRRALFRTTLAGATAPAFADPAETALLLIEGDLASADTWRAFTGLVGELEAALGEDAVTSILDVRAVVRATGPPDATALFEGETRPPPAALTPAALARHPLNTPALLTPELDAALVRLAPDPTLAPVGAARRIQDAAVAVAAGLPPGLDHTLTGLPIVRLELVTSLARQQPWLLGGGLAVGFALGAVLLGRVSDAVVVATMPVVVIVTLYGALGQTGLRLTPLINNLPLLLLALAFTTSLHLVYAARGGLHAHGHDFARLAATMRRVVPAVVLSALTTALAFLTLLATGSEALARFGLLGAAAVMGLVPAAVIVHPAVMAFALRLGWRPVPARHDAGRVARAIEAGCLTLARGLDARRRVIALAALAATVAAGVAFAQTRPAFSFLDDIRRDAAVAESSARVGARFDAGAAIVLPLPLELDPPDPAALTPLRTAHEAAVAAFPGAAVLSPWTLIDWLAATGRAVTADRLDTMLAAAPPPFRRLLLAGEGTPALVLTLAPRESAAIAAAAARLEAAVGERLGADLAGTAQGLAVDAARRGPELVAAVARGLAAAAAGAALLLAVACRSARVALIALVANLLPVLLVGATLVVTGQPLRLASAMALTIALGIAVDGTAHLLNRFAPLAARRRPRAALARTLRELGPVLVMSTAVLCLGLVPALGSWSAGVALFAGFAIATLVFALIADLVVLPPLLVLGRARHQGSASGR
ncbi:MAG: hypothetical protein GVY33_03430 [Alphaproteobacteria bacterium]|jgi:predicted RND superfamily exporter protein|nr:hypothetical protein [Alphaproteobacteria bacterium]